jgi:hypothetical protein
MAALMGMGGGAPVPPNQMMIPHFENMEQMDKGQLEGVLMSLL